MRWQLFFNVVVKIQGSKEKIPSLFVFVALIIILCDGSLLEEATLVKREHISTSVDGAPFKTM